MGFLQSASNAATWALQTISRKLDPRPFDQFIEMQAAFRHKAEEVVKSLATGKIRLLPYYGNLDGETPNMRRAYRSMMREPTVRAAVYQIILPTCFLNLDIEPASDDPVDKEAAQFIKDNILRSYGGVVQLTEATLLGSMIEGYSVAEKVWAPAERGRWKGRTMLRAIKARDTRHYQVEVDEFLNVTAIYSAIDQKCWPTSKFVNHRNLPVYDHPAGSSEMKAAYRPAWMLDSVWKLRQAGLQRWSMPFLRGQYQLGNKPMMAAMEAAMANAKGDGFILVPQGATIDAMQIATGSQSDMAAAVADLGKEVLISITLAHLQSSEGQTKDGAGDTSIHKEMQELRIWRNAVDLANLIDYQITPQLMEWNYPGRDYPRALFNGVNDGDVMRELAIDEKLQAMGFPLSLEGVVQRTKRQPSLNDSDTLKAPAAQGFAQPITSDSKPGGGSLFPALEQQRDTIPEINSGKV